MELSERLESGNIIELRSGELLLVIDCGLRLIFVNDVSLIRSDDYDKRLLNRNSSDLDIIKVFEGISLANLKQYTKDSAYKRSKTILTKEEIAEKLNIPTEELEICEEE